MKIVIDIPEEKLNIIRRKIYCGMFVSDLHKAIAEGVPYEEQPQGECKTCRHRDPEDKKCDCGGLERQGCLFPVSDDYFCKFYEKGGAV